MCEYLVELERVSTKQIRIRGYNNSGVFRINSGDSIVFSFYASLGSELCIVGLNEDLIATLPAARVENDVRRKTKAWSPNRPGPYNIRQGAYMRRSLSEFFPIGSTIVVNPAVDVSSLRMLTVMPRRLGRVPEWPGVIKKLAIDQNYNAVHFTPCQPSGPSHSSYSISDVLDVDPSLFGSTGSKEERWTALRNSLSQIASLKITDVVLNHASSSGSWATKCAEATYSLSHCRYLTGAAELDAALDAFAASNPQYICLSSEEELQACMHGIRVVLERFNFRDFFQIDIPGSLVDFRACQLDKAVHASPLDQALAQVGVSRSEKIVVKVTGHCWDAASAWQHLTWLQGHLGKLARECFESAYSACECTIRYERLRVGKIDEPLVPRYFSILENGDKAANNGWVMNWPAGIDFAAPGHHLVFMRRHVVAWGDCLKLRYAEAENATSTGWTVMEEYCRKIATTFDGVRLDNCHSTPLFVLRRLISVMRAVRPNLVIVAELFTGEAGNDALYESTLGIDLLVKEAMQTSSSDELMGKLWSVSNCALADLAHHEPSLRTTKASAILYDATHDNSTCQLKFGSFREALPLAVCVAAAPAAVGSSVGFDSLRTVMPSVVTAMTRARIEDFPLRVIKQAIRLNGYADAKRVEVFGSWNNWAEGLVMHRHSIDDAWELRDDAKTTNPDVAEYKCLIDRNVWVVEPSVGVTAREPRNNIFGRPGLFSDLKSELFSLHAMMHAYSFFSLVHANKVIEIKRLASDGSGYIFLALFGYDFANGVAGPTEVTVESQLDRVVMAVSLEAVPDSSEDVDSMTLEHFEGQLVHYTDQQLGLTISDKTVTIQNVPVYGFVVMKMRPFHWSVDSLPPPPLEEITTSFDFSNMLFSCESEETAYDIPNRGKLLFAGLQGVIAELESFGSDSARFLESAMAENIRAGDWLFDFIVGRWSGPFPLLHAWAVNTVKPQYERIPSGLKPRFFDLIFRTVVNTQVMKKWTSMYGGSTDGLVERLKLASFQFTTRDTVAAGLPHFASGYMRCWGRDTFIAFPGLFLSSGRFEEGKGVILAFARVVRHGLIPNLYDDGRNPRYNSRDACWCFLEAIKRYMEYTGDDAVLDEFVELSFPDKAFAPSFEVAVKPTVTLGDVVTGILMSHWFGIDFIEEGAIDDHMEPDGFHVTAFVCHRTGLVIGGNPLNCGTWMDKMGSSARTGNRGIPATSRHGANIEINGLALSVLQFFSGSPRIQAAYRDILVMWSNTLGEHWEAEFWTEDLGWYRDTIRGDSKGGKLRPNGLFALSVIPISAVNSAHAKRYIERCEESLLGPLGMRTLPADDPDYNGWYDNADESCGYNYHNGPEWVWLFGHFVHAASRFGAINDSELKTMMERHDTYLRSDMWRSLPELTNANGQFCRDSCPSQAWSVCCLLDALRPNNIS